MEKTGNKFALDLPKTRSLPPIFEDKSSDVRLLTTKGREYLLQLFKYRNISWRYLLCHTLPLQQQILVQQLKREEASWKNKEQTRKNREKERREEEEEEEEEEIQSDEDNPSDMHHPWINSPSNSNNDTHPSIVRKSSFPFSPSVSSKRESVVTPMSPRPWIEESISDASHTMFYHLPIIDTITLKKLFVQGREEYETLKQLYLTPQQMVPYKKKKALYFLFSQNRGEI
ncbi:hypothetical protein RFI_04483 [Reticulomyxa filosa]|uniref:Uncharacterized protein n=1 Tax=Reticulomyxa filosa TaxID=46433 RepID=X6P4X2_RETFI|nr:hypothetical protein RFI_04483 [Reticulomyxa filosa]|eukprot:ETO32637.1 hypothetical protein RFI_04483 [Reticulomyxa filosa]